MRDGEGVTQRYYYDPITNPQEYFQYSSSSLFEVRYLNDITNNIVFSAVTFQSRAEVYFSNNRIRDKELFAVYGEVQTQQNSRVVSIC